MNQEKNKKEKILEIAFRQFSLYDYDKVSVFQIAKLSEISRTDFYNYFENKESLYICLIDKIKNEFVLQYKKDYSDIFELSNDFFDFLCKYKNTKYQNFIENLFKNRSPNNSSSLLCDYTKNLNPKCKPTEDETIIGIMIFSSIFHLISFYYKNDISKDELNKKYDKIIHILKYGYKQNQGEQI